MSKQKTSKQKTKIPVNEKLRTYLLHLEMEKSDERLKFEREHRCWVYITREENQYGYDIHSVYDGVWKNSDCPEQIASDIRAMKLMARFNMGNLRCIWLPKSLGENLDEKWFMQNKELLDKYSEPL